MVAYLCDGCVVVRYDLNRYDRKVYVTAQLACCLPGSSPSPIGT